VTLEDDEAEVAGRWRVERVGGFLPPGLRKRIGRGGGSTRLGPLPLALFRVRGRTLDYRLLPIRDELTPAGDGSWLGRGLLFGREFCRFRLVRDDPSKPRLR
jgi:hypothetical protein